MPLDLYFGLVMMLSAGKANVRRDADQWGVGISILG